MARNALTGKVFIVALVVALWSGWAGAAVRDYPGPVDVKDAWSYRWGDSPVDSSGTFTWLAVESGPEWSPLPGLDWPPGREGREHVWLRTRLPDTEYPHPVLYLPNVAVAFEVYLDDDLIYSYGAMRPDPRAKYAVVNVHFVPLPESCAGGVVSLRIFSNVFVIGIDASSHPPLYGEEKDVLRRMMLAELETTAVGFLLIFTGLFSLLTFFIRFRDDLFAPLSFAAFSICLGLFIIFVQVTTQFIFSSDVFKLYTMALSFLFFPVGMFGYLQHTIFRTAGPVSRRVIWVLFWLHLVLAVAAVILDLAGLVPIPVGMRPYNMVFAATVPVTLVVTIRHARRGGTTAKIAAWGFVVFGSAGFLDLIQGLGLMPHVRWVSHWGALVFVGCLGYVLEQQFTESHRKLKVYSQQLVEKSEQLEEYSRTLEEKVAERTRSLDEKNRQLENTLKELRDTQEQLVIREKMASLGSLVAGVAHEINNPIGAVISASDVASRCGDVVREFFDQNAQAETPKVHTASQLLDENVRVISEAAHRVSEIVKSLKNFARLDEAEFQKTDIHAGIDSTLTLVKHLVKGRIEVVTDYGDVPELLVYPNQLNQVFMNLIVNAIDAIEDTGTITIRTNSDSLNAYITVADTGRGISAENLRRVFDPGFTTKGVGVGTGLGLAISYSIVHKHGGALDVESEPGKGTTFRIVLPLRRVDT